MWYLKYSFLLLFCQMHSQIFPTEVQAENYILKLQENGIDTIASIKHDCVGCFRIVDLEKNCEDFNGASYIFWKQNGKTYITKRDDCFDYPKIKVSKDDFWDFYFTNASSIAQEKIKYPQYIINKDGNDKKYSMDKSHYFFDKIIIYAKPTPHHLNKLPDYYFEEKIKEGNYKNINYEYNLNSFTNKFRLKLASLIEKNKRKLERKK